MEDILAPATMATDYRPLVERAIACATASAIAILGPAIARGEPAARLAITGDCPSAAQVREALSAWIVVVDGEQAAWTIEVTRAVDAAELAMRDRGGSIVLSRRIASRDCTAVAAAIAVMVHGQLVELKLLPAPGAAAVEPAVDPPAAPMVAAAAPIAPEAARRETGPELRVRRAAAPAPRPSSLALAVSGGLDVAGVAPERAGFGQLDAAFRLRGRWRVRGAIGASAPSTIEAGMDRLDVWRTTARVGAGARLTAGSIWVQPAIGAGIAVWRIDPRDLAGAPPRWRVQPVAEAGVAVGAPLGRRLALRLEALATLFLVTHRYVVDPDGAIARSPRSTVSLAGGLEWSF